MNPRNEQVQAIREGEAVRVVLPEVGQEYQSVTCVGPNVEIVSLPELWAMPNPRESGESERSELSEPTDSITEDTYGRAEAPGTDHV